MDRKAFFIILTFMLLSIAAGAAVRYYQPRSTAIVDFSDFPLQRGDWSGVREEVPPFVINLLRPKEIFSGDFTDTAGQRVHLLFDFFVNEQSFGGPHSPRNCLPGGGWTIDKEHEYDVELNGRTIQAGRFALSFEGQPYVMDFWYVTNFGETASDYRFKLYSMLASLTFRPREVGFIRMIAEDSPEGVKALGDFERLFVPEIYHRLPFKQ